MDILWINALGKIIFDRGWHDETFCRRHTIGFEAYSQSLDGFDIDAACNRAGVSRSDLKKTAELLHGRRAIFKCATIRQRPSAVSGELHDLSCQ